jgi:predicted transcriptional regulator
VRLKLNPDAAESKLRLVGLQLALSGLRIGEEYRRTIAPDLDSVVVVLAVTAIALERPLRAQADITLYDMKKAIAINEVTRCNVASIAAATGLNRETARRKVNNLVKRGLLRKLEGGAIVFDDEVRLNPALTEMLCRQVNEVARLTNILLQHDIIVPS